MIIEAVIYILVLLTAFPCGLVLAKLCDDELVKDKKYFKSLSIFLLIISLLGLFFYSKPSIILAPIYMIIILEVMLYKSRNLKTKKSKK